MSREALRAILKGDINKLDEFIQQGLDINETTEKEKWNYLHRALITRSAPKEMVKHLISCGVDVNAIDSFGNTPLYYAARLKNGEIIKLLLDSKANVNHVNKDGISPLRELFSKKPFDYNSVKLLLDAGADLDQKVEGGGSVKSLAETVAFEEVLYLRLF